MTKEKNIHDHVVTFGTSEVLRRIGAPQKALWYWEQDRDGPGFSLRWHTGCGGLSVKYAAFLQSELMEILPGSVSSGGQQWFLEISKTILDEYLVSYLTYVGTEDADLNVLHTVENERLVQALAEMLIYLYDSKMLR